MGKKAGKIFSRVADPLDLFKLGPKDKKPAVAAPPTTPEPPMPTQDDASVEAAKAEQERRRRAAQGRASTILSDSDSDALGGI